MHKKLTAGLGAVAFALAIVGPAMAQSGANPRAERRLIGISLFSDYKAVLQRLGAPDRIEPGAVSGVPVGQTSGAPAAGGLPGLTGIGPMGMGGMSAPMMGGSAPMMSSMGPPMPGPMSSGGMTAPMPGYMAGMGGSTGNPYGGGMRRGEDAGDSRGGLAAPGGAGQQVIQSEEGEVTWIYERGTTTYQILFNKDGRVIQIQLFGYSNPATTSRGIRLGDTHSRIYSLYGWPGASIKDGSNLILDYGRDYQVAFQLAERKGVRGPRVVGITVAATDGMSTLVRAGARGGQMGPGMPAGMGGMTSPMGIGPMGMGGMSAPMMGGMSMPTVGGMGPYGGSSAGMMRPQGAGGGRGGKMGAMGL